MFDEQEKKLIQRYCLWPKLAVASLLVAVFIGALWLILVMIGDLAMDAAGFYALGLYVYLGIALVYTVLFCVFFLTVRLGMRKQPWQNILQKAKTVLETKDYSGELAAIFGSRAAGNLLRYADNDRANQAGDALQAAAAIGTVVTVSAMMNELSRNAKGVARLCGVPLKKTAAYVWPLVCIPIVLLIGVYIPHFVSSKQFAMQQAQTASVAVYQLKETLETDCAYVMIEDPLEEYRSDGYRVSGYLYDWDQEQNSRIIVIIDNDGKVDEVTYMLDVDIARDKQDTIRRLRTDLSQLNALLLQSGLEARSPWLVAVHTMPEDFLTQFANTSYYEPIDFMTIDHITVSYETESEEDYDEYSASYVYYALEEE